MRSEVEGELKAKATARSGQLQFKDAGRHTGTGSEVLYTRDERARDREVLHPQRDVLYKSGVYALKVMCLTLGDPSCAQGCRVRRKLAEGKSNRL